MKVLHVIPTVAARYGGPSEAIVEMCRALRSRNVDTLVATTDADGPERLQVECDRVQTYRDMPVIFFTRHVNDPLQYSRGLARWLDAHVGEFEVVHVHGLFSHSSVAAARACRRHGVPYILRPFGTLDPWSLRQKPRRKRLFLRLAGLKICREASAIAYTTGEERRLAEGALHLTRGVVLPLGLPDEAFSQDRRPDDQTREPYVLVLCRLHPKKGLDVLLRAFMDLDTDSRCSGWRLVIAGDGDPAFVDHLKRLAGADARVRFEGWVDGTSKTALLTGASLFVLPSHQENFGIAIVEAMARGVPALVAPGVNLAPDIEAAGAGWVAATDVPALREALRHAIHNHDDRSRRGAAARRLAERFRWRVIVDDLIAEYRAAIDGVPRRPLDAAVPESAA